MLEALRSSPNLLCVVKGWDEAAVPLEKRGVRLSWLKRFVDEVQSHLNRGVEAPPEFFRSKQFELKQGASKPVDARSYRFLNTHGLVSQVVKPLTQAIRAPIFALVPEKFRGVPASFVSHPWNSLLRGPERQRIGTVDALCDAAGEHDDIHVWIDFICYNQHALGSIANDMCAVIASMGSLLIPATPTPVFTRSWCLWELLSAHRFAAAIDLRVVSNGYRNDKILAVNSLYRSFQGIENARSISAQDQAEIYDGVIGHFGSLNAANESLLKLIEEKFAGPWFELQGRDSGLQYSQLPWHWDKTRSRGRSKAPFFLPSLLEAGVLGSDSSVGEVFKASGLEVARADELGEIIDSRQVVDDPMLLGASNAAPPDESLKRQVQVDIQLLNRIGPAEDGQLNSAYRMNCPSCGEPVVFLQRPRYFYSEESGSAWRNFLQGIRQNRCKCGLTLSGSVSSFYAASWTAVTLEPPAGLALPPEIFADLVDKVLTGIAFRLPLLLFQSVEDIQQAMSGGNSKPFLLIPYPCVMYQDVAETARALGVLIAAAVRVGLYSDAYLFIRNAAGIHPDIFWVFFETAQELARLADHLARDNSKQNDFELVMKQLERWRKAPSLDRKTVFVCFGENTVTQSASPGQTYYASRGYFDTNQELLFWKSDHACSSLPSWLLPQQPLSLARKCLLDVHIHAAGEFLLGPGDAASQTVSEQTFHARERIVTTYSKLSEAQRAQALEFYRNVGGRDLLGVL
jgi:hypothetical protein